MLVGDPDELGGGPGDLCTGSEHAAEGFPANRRRHVIGATDGPLCCPERVRREIADVHRLDRPVRRPGCKDPAARRHPVQPPREPAHVLAGPEHNARAEDSAPIRPEGLSHGEFAARLLVAVPGRPVFNVFAVVRPGVRRAEEHVRRLRKRNDRPAAVNADGRHEDTSSRYRLQLLAGCQDLARDVTRGVDDGIPWPGRSQPGQIGGPGPVTPDRMNTGDIRAGKPPVERGYFPSAGHSGRDDRMADEPGSAENQQAHANIMPRSGGRSHPRPGRRACPVFRAWPR